MTFNVRRSTSNTFFVRYYNNVPYVYYGDFPVAPVPDSCYPIPYYTSWVDPNITCDIKTFTSIGERTYYRWPQPNIPSQESLNLLAGDPPNFNISRKIKITIPKDPIFSGIYVFDKPFDASPWIFNSGQSSTLLKPYTDSSSSLNGQYLVKLDAAGSIYGSRYEGYFEWQSIPDGLDGNTDGQSTAISAYAFPCYLTFTAVKPPSGVVDGLINTFGSPNPGFPGNLPPITGRECHRLAVGIKLPIRYRQTNGDWILVDQIGHIISGTTNYVSGIQSQPSTFNINLINNNPYNAETSTAISSNTGINQNGFAFKVTTSGLGFDGYSTYPASPTYFLGNYQKHQAYNYNWYDSNNGNAARTTVVDQTKFSGPKIPIEAWVTFVDSCRNPNLSTPCVETIVPTSIIPTIINTGCLGSAINADYWCGENLTKPDIKDFDNNSITGITPVYSGVSNIYPVTRLSDSTSNLFATTTGIIKLPYTGGYDPNIFRKWINEEIKFISLKNSQIDTTYNNIDIYWKTDEQNYRNIYAKLYPDDSETVSNNCIYMDFADESFLNGYYSFDTSTGYWISLSNSNVQIRYISGYWYVGIIINGVYNIYYKLFNYPDIQYIRQFTNSSKVYYFVKTSQYLTLNTDANNACQNVPQGPEIITLSPYTISSSEAIVLKFWRNLFSDGTDCGNSSESPSVTTQTVIINCVSGSVIVDGQPLASGQSKTYNSIPFISTHGNVLDSPPASNYVVIVGTETSVVTATATLNWSTTRDHDLYGQLLTGSSVVTYSQSPRSIPIGVWITGPSYLGVKTSYGPMPTTTLGKC
jgi:hypothetical protein